MSALESPKKSLTTIKMAATSPSCYFSSIELLNIKSFGQPPQVLDFKLPCGTLSQWTLLLGDNGVGKTTILQCLAEMSAKLTCPIKFLNEENEAPVYRPKLDNHLKNGQNKIPYARVGGKDSCITVRFAKNAELGQPVSLVENTQTCVTADVIKGSLRSYNLIDDKCALLQPCGYGAFRRFGNTKLGAELNPDSCSTLFDDNEPLLNVEEWLLRSDYAATKSKDARAEKRLKSIKKLLVNFLPEVEDIRIKPSGTDVPTPEAKTPDGWVPVRSLSTGYRATMAWVTDFAARMLDRYPESPDPFSEPAVVLVDQIDTHLHPKWQRQLIQDLSQSFPATQFIVTAHSPLMVLAMPDANMAVLRRKGEHVLICNHPDDVKGWRVDQIIASNLFEEQPTRDINTQDMLEERRTLLSKNKITKQQQARLKELNEWASGIPTADTPEDIRAMEILRRASAKIKD